MKKTLLPLFFLFCLFKIQILYGQNYYVPYNFAPINITEKGDFTFSASENIFRSYRNQNFSISQSPKSNLYWTVGGVLTLNRLLSLKKERTSIIDFSAGAYYFFQHKKKRKRRKKGKYAAMKKGILVLGGLGYSFGKNKLDLIDGKSIFRFQKVNLNLGVQLQLKHIGISYSGGLGFLNFKKVKSKGKIDQRIRSFITSLASNNSFMFLDASIRCFYGNQYGKLYFERITFPTNTRLGFDFKNSRFSLGLSLRIHEFFKLKK